MKTDKKTSWRVKRNGEVYVRGELVGSLLRVHYGTRVSDHGWKFKPHAKYRKQIGVVEANTKRDVMYFILRKIPHSATASPTS
jgi:hypothetical protein